VFVASTFRTATGNVLPAGLVNTVQVVVPGVPAGQAATLQVRVWDNEGGTILSWAQLLASQYQSAGKSSLFVSQPLGGLYDPNAPPSLPPQMTGWTSFNIGGEGCVPEPSVFALAALGLSVLLWRKPKST
jgi:PEP-CTERM motif